jgi:phospholipid/cholesterol/gamma-HCH transport system ATP-binding protein
MKETKNLNSSDIIVEMKNIKKSFLDNDVLKDINFKLAKGENLVVLGKSGTGKSVLIKCIVKLIETDEGELTVFNQDIIKLKDKELNETRSKSGSYFKAEHCMIR